MIDQIVDLINQNGKNYTFITQVITIDDLINQKVFGIYPAECSNTLILIAEKNKMFKVYEIYHNSEKIIIRKYPFEFYPAFDDDGGNELL